jgi:hypothetical protein
MRNYLRNRRRTEPAKELWRRARARATRAALPFDLAIEEVVIPAICPVLGIPLSVGKGRHANSPSLNRIVPSLGYVTNNVMVISDRANRLRSDHSAAELVSLAERAKGNRRTEYSLVIDYVAREAFLADIRSRAEQARALQTDLTQVATCLEAIFSRGLVRDGSPAIWSL